LLFRSVKKRVGDLADANGLLQTDEHQGLSFSDTEHANTELLHVLDVEAIEQAVQPGLCEAVNLSTLLDDSNFYLSVDVEPDRVVAGFVAERPDARCTVSH